MSDKMSDKMSEQLKELESEIILERSRLSSDRMDISFGELINLYKNKELIIHPEYQRLFRWNSKQKTAFIESILLGIPIPPIFVAEDSNGIWELIDGLQRVSSFISFFGDLDDDFTKSFYDEFDKETEEEEKSQDNINLSNKWSLERGGLVNNLEGLNVDTIPNKYRINLKRAVCRVEILRGESNISMKYELFKRLNSGGSKLTPQEIRNAVFRGINPIVNDLLLELSRDVNFIKLTSLSNQKKLELYDQELILRFVALLNNHEKINDNLENYLNNFMEDAVKSGKFNKNYYIEAFKEVLNLVAQVGDEKTFRNQNNLFVPSLFEGILIGVSQNIDKYKTQLQLLSDKIKEIKDDGDYRKYSGTGSNSKSRIKNRLKRAQEIFS